MAIKRIIGRKNEKYKTCLRCNKKINKTLRDDTIYVCENCGQQHFVDVYPDTIALTVTEQPEIRRRNLYKIISEQEKARQALVGKVDDQSVKLDEWEEAHKDWLEEVAEMPESDREIEFALIDEEMKERVTNYIEKRKSI